MYDIPLSAKLCGVVAALKDLYNTRDGSTWFGQQTIDLFWENGECVSVKVAERQVIKLDSRKEVRHNSG